MAVVWKHFQMFKTEMRISILCSTKHNTNKLKFPKSKAKNELERELEDIIITLNSILEIWIRLKENSKKCKQITSKNILPEMVPTMMLYIHHIWPWTPTVQLDTTATISIQIKLSNLDLRAITTQACLKSKIQPREDSRDRPRTKRQVQPKEHSWIRCQGLIRICILKSFIKFSNIQLLILLRIFCQSEMKI